MSTEEGKQNNNMTPQEAKAKELVNCMNDKIISFENVRLRGEGFEMSKQCALIAVNEIIEALEAFGYSNAMYDDFATGQITSTDKTCPTEFWLSVKEAINKM